MTLLTLFYSPPSSDRKINLKKRFWGGCCCSHGNGSCFWPIVMRLLEIRLKVDLLEKREIGKICSNNNYKKCCKKLGH